MSDKKLALLLGAGATVADVSSKTKKDEPPLDKRFFKLAGPQQGEAKSVVEYMKVEYGINIRDTKYDSFEDVMVRVYTDISNARLGTQAARIFLDLLRLFNKRLSETTNVSLHRRRYLYRLFYHYLDHEQIDPNSVTVITFNQDIQAEKTLDFFQSQALRGNARTIFSFPGCYSMPQMPRTFLGEPVAEAGFFKRDSSWQGGIRILKLHGSLNWYSAHRDQNPKPNNIFNPERIIQYSSARSIPLYPAIKGKVKPQFLFPVVIPPVSHKSAIFHQNIHEIWRHAEASLSSATEVLILGYSCPNLDHESCNLLMRTLRNNPGLKRLIVIDPDSNVLKRYIDMLDPPQLDYYKSTRFFLEGEIRRASD